MSTYATPLFGRLTEDKQRAVLNAATVEFARSGFTAAKVDTIAAQAGISVGALYKYFGSKESCFLSVLEDGMRELEARLDHVMTSESDHWSRIEAIVRLIPEHSRKNAEALRLYQEICGEGLSSIAEDFCRRFEGLSARYYSTILAEARAAGSVRSDLDENYAAFCLDNIFMSLQFAYSCGYHMLRKKVYLGGAKDADDAQIVEHTLKFLRYGLSGK